MADEQDKWLNRETAERLLRGEPLEAVDPSARDQAERLSRMLGALSAEAAPAPSELPGEQAALAAFRKAREAAADARTAALAAEGTGRRTGAGARGHDAGAVRLGAPARTGAHRPRWGRPARLALAAVVAAGTLGGVAVAAGTGVLPTPFDLRRPGPAATATTDTSGRPPATPGPRASGAPGGGADSGRPDDADRADGGGTDGRPGTSAPARTGTATSGGRWTGAVTACRDLRSGAGLNADRRRALEHLAGGSARLSQYCRQVLSTGDHAVGDPAQGTSRDGGGQSQETGQGSGHGGSGDRGGSGGSGAGDDESHPGNGLGGSSGSGGDDRTGNGGGTRSGSGTANGGGTGSGGGTSSGRERVRHRGPAVPAPARRDPGQGPGGDSGRGPGSGSGSGGGSGRGHGGSASPASSRPTPAPLPAR